MSERIEGKIQRHEKGYGFLIPDDEQLEDVFIPPGKLNGSISGDRVEIVTEPSDRGRNDVGKVLQILERGLSHVVGIIRISSGKTVVLPLDDNLPQPIRVPDQSGSTRVENGQVVEVEIESYQPLRGVIVDVLGEPGDPDVEEEILLKKYELDPEFPDEVIREAENLPDEVPAEDLESRMDLRDLTVITIDPYDAKDLDDAVSVEMTQDGQFRVGVHITDVSHYVDRGTRLDDEARRRATSTYLAGDVIPMFPKEFSNGIGSLNSGNDRLTVTVFMTVDPAGRVVDAEFHESVINVDQRLSYDEVDEYLDDENVTQSLEGLTDLIDLVIDVSQRMRSRRMDRGSLDFDLPEVSLHLSEGEVEEIIHVEHTLSHQAIEEFMIAANEAVAEYLTENNIPLLYRVHEPPAREDVREFARFIEGMGYQISIGEENDNGLHPSEFQRVLDRADSKPEERIIAWNMLRSMKQARYSPENFGHFGLASECYCHFTSPIRRYPDLMVHRVLKTSIVEGQLPEGQKQNLHEELPELATHASEMEQNATDAERESTKVKLLEYMNDKVGEEMEGYITSVLEFGCFVQLENTIEGLIHVSNLNDYYEFNEEDYTLKAESSGRILHIGDRVKVRVARVDVPQRQLDFDLVEVLETHLGDMNG